MTAPASFTSADEAMDMVRAGLEYLARADAASLPTVTQARLLRELERAGSQHVAARARVLAAFTGQRGYEDDAHGGPRPWLTAQTRVSTHAASGSVKWMHRLAAHPLVAEALAAGKLSESYAGKICYWSDLLPPEHRAFSDEVLVDEAAGGGDLDYLSRLAEEMFARCAPPDTDNDDDARFRDRWFEVTRLFQGRGRPDGDLTPECLAAVQEVLDTLGKKAGPEDERSAGQRRHDALEEAMRLLLASGCLPERAGQPALVQLHLTLEELVNRPTAQDVARDWLTTFLRDRQPDSPGPAAPGPTADGEPGDADFAGGGQSGHTSDGQPGGAAADGQPGDADSAADGDPAPGQDGQPGPDTAAPDLGGMVWPAPAEVDWPGPGITLPLPAGAAGARRAQPGAGETGWLRGKAAEAYTCDARIAPMVCGHLDRNALAAAVAELLAGDLASPGQDPAPGPRCECDERPAARRAPIPGQLLSTGLPGLPITPAGPVPAGLTPPGTTRTADTADTTGLTGLTGTTGTTGTTGLTDTIDLTGTTGTSGLSLTPGGLARLQDTIVRYAVSLLSGPAGLAAYLRTQLTGGFFPSVSLPLDVGEATEQVPPHLRRAVIKRDRHCSFPGCSLPPVRCHVHHVIPRSKGGPTRLDNLTLLCAFHHLIAVHRWGWTLTLHGDGTTTATSPAGTKVWHSHSPPPADEPPWADRPGHDPPATAAA